LRRRIICIDEEKCDGCGICAEACHEGAIAIVDGKARLVKESYCDGLGDCIGPCPRDAISIEERDAEEYDAEAVGEHLAGMAGSPSGCPGACPEVIEGPSGGAAENMETRPSRLSAWPVQITLVPPNAPFLKKADLLLAADCVPFAYADFHERFVRGRTVLVGCPKLDDAEYYLQKLEEIFRLNSPSSVTVVYMEVPCCGGLPRLARMAAEASGRIIPMRLVRIGIRGKMIEDIRVD